MCRQSEVQVVADVVLGVVVIDPCGQQPGIQRSGRTGQIATVIILVGLIVAVFKFV